MQKHHTIVLKTAGEQVVVQYDGLERVITAERIPTSRFTSTTRWHPTLDVSSLRRIQDTTDRSIVRIDIGGMLYCYKNRDNAVLGDHVAVVLPNGQVIIEKVQAYGRGGYDGPVYKTARKVQLPDVD